MQQPAIVSDQNAPGSMHVLSLVHRGKPRRQDRSETALNPPVSYPGDHTRDPMNNDCLPVSGCMCTSQLQAGAAFEFELPIAARAL